MTLDWQQYSIEQLRAHAVATFRQGGGSRPDVLLIDIDGHRAVLKDQGAADKWFAALLGPLLTWRECKALTKLESLSCIPNLLSRPTNRAFLMSYHESEPITRLNNVEPNWAEFFPRLQTAINEVHAAGVAHNDLRNPTNTLITADGKPILVDLVACFCKGQAWNKPNQWLFNKFTQVDLSAVTKLKTKVAPECLGDNEINPEDIAGKAGLAAKGFGQWVRRVSRRLFTK